MIHHLLIATLYLIAMMVGAFYGHLLGLILEIDFLPRVTSLLILAMIMVYVNRSYLCKPMKDKFQVIGILALLGALPVIVVLVIEVIFQ